jgi:NAD(P)-dependent dehydrogenase (short-subunit alcohol dehydrogenase family)
VNGLDGKAILVAGGASGIGAATAALLARHGARVAVGDISADGAERGATAIRDAGGDAIAIEYDQGVEASIAALVEQTVGRLGSLAGVVVNAADLSETTLGRDRQLLNMDVSVWERTLRVNLTGAALVARGALPHLLEAGGGGIVFTSSDAAFMGEPSRPAYAASKSGLNALVRHIATRWGKDGIRANAVSPGLVMTETARATATEVFLSQMSERHRSHRFGEPDDIGSTIAFLLSDLGTWVNGQVWSVNGGLVLR